MYSQKINHIFEELKRELGDNLISVYGIGSYFDSSLPSDWSANDMDLVVFVKSLEKLPKRNWTDVRYDKRTIDKIKVWIGYNTIEGYQNKALFEKQAFSNYEWSLLDIKVADNSVLICGRDVRGDLPSLTEINFDYDDVLARSLYHLELSLRKGGKDSQGVEIVREFTKSVFKFAFYVSVLFDKNFHFTSIRKIAKRVDQLAKLQKIDSKIKDFLKFSINSRIKGRITEDFNRTREDFITFIFSLLHTGKLHKEMSYKEIIIYLTNSFSGMPLLSEKMRKKT